MKMKERRASSVSFPYCFMYGNTQYEIRLEENALAPEKLVLEHLITFSDRVWKECFVVNSAHKLIKQTGKDGLFILYQISLQIAFRNRGNYFLDTFAAANKIFLHIKASL